jgi:AraC family transcriptional regulator
MPTNFRHLRAQYYDADPESARSLPKYHARQKAAAGLIMTETRHPPRFQIPSHAHDLHSFCFVLGGELTEHSDSAPLPLATWSLIFTPAGHRHRNAFHDAGGRCFLVELDASWAGRLSSAGPPLDAPMVAEEPELPRLVLGLHREFREPDPSSTLSMESLALEILAGFARNEAAPAGFPGWLLRARDLLHDRFAEPITLAELAGAVGVHPAQLARGFRRRYRHSPGEYQRRLRVDHASRQLATTRRPCAAIAQAAGFADQPHFCRVFKRHTGLTPAEFRSRHAI